VIATSTKITIEFIERDISMNEQNTAILRSEIEQLTKIEAEIDRLQRRREVIRNNLRVVILAKQSSPESTTLNTLNTQTLELAVPSAGVTLRLTTSTTRRIDTTKLRADLPDVAERYTKLVLREQLTVKTGLPIPAIPQPSALVKEQEVN
jgi:hypothetical protein